MRREALGHCSATPGGDPSCIRSIWGSQPSPGSHPEQESTLAWRMEFGHWLHHQIWILKGLFAGKWDQRAGDHNQVILLSSEGGSQTREVRLLTGRRSGSHTGQLRQEPESTAHVRVSALCLVSMVTLPLHCAGLGKAPTGKKRPARNIPSALDLVLILQ